MDIRQLQAFAAVMSTGSITAAGQALGRSQPTITRLIQELEARLGYALFVRQGPKVLPTEQGFQIYDDVMNALHSVKNVEQKAAAIAGETLEPLRISATSALMCGLVPQALAKMTTCKERTSIRSASPEQVVRDVISGAAHVGLSSLPLDHSGVKVHWIGSAPCVVAIPKNSPLASKNTLNEGDLLPYTPITMANPYRLRQRLRQALPELFQKTGLIETNSSVNALCAVKAGLGVAVLEPLSCQGLAIEGVTVRPLEVTIPFHFGAITLQGRQNTSAVEAFIHLLQLQASLIAGFQLHKVSQYREILHEQHVDACSEKVVEQ